MWRARVSPPSGTTSGVEISTLFIRKYWKSPFKYLLDLLLNKRIKIFLLACPIGERPQPQQQPNRVWALPYVAISLIYATIYATSYIRNNMGIGTPRYPW